MAILKNRANAIAFSLFLMFAMATSLIVAPNANAQSDLIMNLPGAEGIPHEILIHAEVDIDLNGGPGGNENISLWIKYPGRSAFTYIDTYLTRSNGDLDVYDFDFNETGDFECKWAYPPDSPYYPGESNVEIARVVLEILAPTYAFIGATPNPVGVNQECLLHVGITQQLIRIGHEWKDLSVTIERPDNKTDTITGINTDATGGTGRIYIPDIEGTYYIQTHFPETVTTSTMQSSSHPVGATMMASDSEIMELVVQAEPVPYYAPHALPTEYWVRPIDAQLREWSPIAGSWLEDPDNLYAPYNDDAPESAHILWAKPFTTGGLAGGEMGEHGMDCGDAYEGKYDWRHILMGKLYYTDGPYERPRYTHCIDLHTGEELWAKVLRTESGDTIDFCQLIYWDSYNYHAVFEYLWISSGSSWYGYDAFTGEQISEYENVPSGSNIYGENGVIYRYSISTSQGRMTLWNQSAMVSMRGSWGSQHDNRVGSRALDAESGSRFDRAIALNFTFETGLPGNVRAVKLGDRVVGCSYSQAEVTSWAFSLVPGNEGSLLFKKTWTAPSEWADGDLTVSMGAISIDDGVYTIDVKETRQHYGFSTETGEYLWVTEPEHYLDHYNYGRYSYIAYGNLYAVGMSGITNAYDVETGDLVWKYEAYDPLSEILWSNNWPVRPLFITDGKIYLGHEEHSVVDPKPRGAPFICLDATTGELIWRADGLFRQTFWGGCAIIGDSIIATQDTYSQQLFGIGKGPSNTDVTASPKVSVHGSSVLVEGMVTDLSPGTNDAALKMRFPDGVPAVSDANMSDWMLYVYKQFERPADVVGVDVVVSVLDPNGNCYEVGRTKSDDSGLFSVAFEPEVPGKYTIMASFEGSKSYYGSFAETAVFVEEAPQPTPVPTPMPASVADLYLVPGIAGVIVAIAVVGAIIILMLRKR